MTLEPLLQTDLTIKVHTALAFAALLMGGYQLASKKGTRSHKFIGRIWVTAMFIVALSSFFINEIRLIGPFSPIHLLSLLVLHSVVTGMLAIRSGNIKEHAKSMKMLYFFGLILAGIFTLAPGRVFYRVLLGT